MALSRHAAGPLAALLLALAPAVDAAGSGEAGSARVTVRAGQHPGFTRVVFDWPHRVGYAVVQEGAIAEIRFDDPAQIELAPLDRPLRNISATRALASGVSLTLRPGVAIRHSVVGTRVVVDLVDAPAVRSASAPTVPPASPAPSVAPAAPPAAPPAAVAPAVQPPEFLPAPPPAVAAALPVAPLPPVPVIASQPVLPPPPLAGVTPPPVLPAAVSPPPVAPRPAEARLPFSGPAAAFRRFGALIAVFDAPPVPVETLRRLHPLLAAAEAVTLPDAAAFRLPGAENLALRRDGEGWLLTEQGESAPADRAIRPSGVEGRLMLPASRTGRVLTAADPDTGGLLLVGTVTTPGERVRVGRSFVDLDLLPTELGVAIVPRSDQLALRAAAEGFTVVKAAGALALAPEAARAGLVPAELPRVLDLRDLSPAALAARRLELTAMAANVGVQARGGVRLDLAETLLSLALGAEAQSVLQLAVAEDPRLAGRPRTLMLAAAAALLAGRSEEALASLADRRLPADGEAALWRGLAATGAEPPDAAEVAAAPIALLYPAPLRARVIPAAAARLAESGPPAVAALLLDGDPEAAALPLARFARARLQERAGDVEAARALYASLAAGRDRDARARALGRLVELRLASGELDPGAAATALEAAIPSWRGDARELQRRVRTAELYRQASQPGRALALLRETALLFPESAELAAAIAEAAMATVTDPTTEPLDAARLLVAGTNAAQRGPAIDRVVDGVAERLLARELPEEAVQLLRQTLPRAGMPALRLRLGEALLATGDAAGALEQLRGVSPDGLDGPERQRRAMAEAAAYRRLGDLAAAVQVLRTLGRPGAAALAEIHAARQEWPAAAEALRQHLGTMSTPRSPLDPASRQAVLRLGAFLALAGDDAGLSDLRETYASQMAGGPLADAFAVLVSGSPSTADLTRLRREMAQLQR